MKHSIGLSPLTFFLNDPKTLTLLHRSSSDISFAPCSWEVLKHLGSDHLPILPFTFSTLAPHVRPPSFNFQKARWNDFAFLFDFHRPFSLSLSSTAGLFTCLAQNAAKFSILLGRIKRQPEAWWSAKSGSDKRKT